MSWSAVPGCSAGPPGLETEIVSIEEVLRPDVSPVRPLVFLVTRHSDSELAGRLAFRRGRWTFSVAAEKPLENGNWFRSIVLVCPLGDELIVFFVDWWYLSINLVCIISLFRVIQIITMLRFSNVELFNMFRSNFEFDFAVLFSLLMFIFSSLDNSGPQWRTSISARLTNFRQSRPSHKVQPSCSNRPSQGSTLLHTNRPTKCWHYLSWFPDNVHSLCINWKTSCEFGRSSPVVISRALQLVDQLWIRWEFPRCNFTRNPTERPAVNSMGIPSLSI